MGARAVLQEQVKISGDVAENGTDTFTPWSLLGGRIEDYLLDCGNYADAIVTIHVSSASLNHANDSIDMCLVTSDSVDTIKLGGVEDAGVSGDGGTWNVHTWTGLVSGDTPVQNRWVKYASKFDTATDSDTDHPIDRYLSWVIDVKGGGGGGGGPYEMTFSVTVTLKTPA